MVEGLTGARMRRNAKGVCLVADRLANFVVGS